MGVPAPIGLAASGLSPLAGDQANAVLTGKISAVGPAQCFAFRGPMNLAIWPSVNTTLTTTAGSLSATLASATGILAGNAINSANVPPGTTIGALAGTAVTLAPPIVTYPGRVSTVQAAITNLPVTAGLLGAVVSGPGIVAGTTVTAILVPAVLPTNTSPGSPGTVQISTLPTVAPANIYPVQQFSFALGANSILVSGADTAAIFTGGAMTVSATVQLERSFDGGSTWIVCNIGSGGTLAQWVNFGPISITFGEPEKQVLYRLNAIVYASGTINYRISQTGGAAESLAIGPLSNG